MPFFTHTRRIAVAYVAIVVFLGSILSWFSWTTVRLDIERELNRCRAEQARADADLQERIGYALWRMDWMLTPLVAQEAARTHWMYQPFLKPTVATALEPNGGQPVPSPLLIQPSPFVILHFQIDDRGNVSSPQSPEPQFCESALGCGVTETQLAENHARLQEIAQTFAFDPLWRACSDRKLPEITAGDLTWLVHSPANVPQNPGAQSIARDTPSQSPIVGNKNVAQMAEWNQPIPATGEEQLGNFAARFDQRAAAANELALNAWAANRLPLTTGNEQRVSEGVMHSVWMCDRMLLVRRVESGGHAAIQCCWLDWPAMRMWLLAEVNEIVPGADLVPRGDDEGLEYSRSLATLPVELIVPSAAHMPGTPLTAPSGERRWWGLALPPSGSVCWSLAIAWVGFILAAASTAWLILGVVQLSDRRAAFASAVTHELRTPLTTFRLYSEMLNGDMLPNAEQRAEYTEGLVQEADRLCRLVDNVLQFARLERGAAVGKSEQITVRGLAERIKGRCQQRAMTAGLTLEWQVSDDVAETSIETAIDAVEQIIFNLVDNACKYAAVGTPPGVQVSLAGDGKWLMIQVRDFGPGISCTMLRRLFQPFARSADETAGTAAGVGLGLALSRQLARQLSGQLTYRSAEPGSQFELRLPWR